MMPNSRTYTVMCQEDTGHGTIWIDTVAYVPDGEDLLTSVQQSAVQQCALDWDMDPQDIICMGVIKGNAEFLYFDDTHFPEP